MMTRHYGLRRRSMPWYEGEPDYHVKAFGSVNITRAICLTALAAGYVFPWLLLYADWMGLCR